MTVFVRNLIVGAATSAIHGVGIGRAALAVRLGGSRAPTLRPGGAPIVIDLYLIKIEVNFRG
jgi:hypothetical protein